MDKNVKYMLLGIFLAVFSVGGFVLAAEEDIFIILAIALPIASIIVFSKGFANKKSEHNDKTN